MTPITLILWLVLGIFIAGIVEIIKWAPGIHFVTKNHPWRVRGTLLFFCIVVFILVQYMRHTEDTYIAIIYLYSFADVAFTHIFYPLATKHMRGPS